MRLRLLPIVIMAGGVLAVLKTIGLVFDGGYILLPDAAIAQEQPADTAADGKEAAAADGKPAEAGAEGADKTAAAATESDEPKRSGSVIDLNAGSKSEKAVLERLGDRRKMLEKRQDELDLREQLLKAAEARLEKRIAELKTLETKIGTAVEKKEKEKAAKLADLVKMYESMKAKSAARVFDRLDIGVLLPIAKQMSPRKLADVMARMSPEAAERLTVALANIETKTAMEDPARGALPKIEGRKTN
ncbi:MAG: hypothetical protein C0606_12125 [Hyphomicrobiales bacterium]|nr:MAG: hypothetical protein C0606_12125 [Hyphomicrobiales bacterium]